MRSRSRGPLSQQADPQLEPQHADADWLWLTGMISSGVWPAIQAELTNRIAAFTRIPPYRLTWAQDGNAGGASARACCRQFACAVDSLPKQGPSLDILIQGALDCIASVDYFGARRNSALAT